ncbi:hypothetical protein Nepgr_031978 [Nepenthes gracilis]|uniref:Uncharacterized protein n=1 Tax=Nepenthes gracilis TaxID=150966 RepID=A0AAD3Y7B3_NEPGR|nr:hypothetical protein Nepgr_031978 [Nepenthes gracilis]
MREKRNTIDPVLRGLKVIASSIELLNFGGFNRPEQRVDLMRRVDFAIVNGKEKQNENAAEKQRQKRREKF